MKRLTRQAACRRLVAFAPLFCLPALLMADGGATPRSVLAPSNPSLASEDPRDAREPRDMTSPRAARRGLRGRSRERTAPESPSQQSPRDMTASPATPTRPGLGRRLESLWKSQRLEDSLAPAQRPAEAGQVWRQPAVQPPVPAMAPAAPAQSTQTAESAPAAPPEGDIRLTQADEEATSVARPTAPDAPLPLDRERVRTLNKPLNEIRLMEPEDVDGIRPVDLASELSPPRPPLVLAGSYFAQAHPARYLYCFSHQPLYFEDANLERCGLGSGACQPVCSAAQFIGRTALLPYSMLVACPGSCVSTLGDCPTCHAYPHGADWNR